MSAVSSVQPGGEPLAPEIAARSPLQLFWYRLRQDKVAITALAIVVFMVFVAVFAPVITSILGLPDTTTQNTDLLGVFGEPTGPTFSATFGVLAAVVLATFVILTIVVFVPRLSFTRAHGVVLAVLFVGGLIALLVGEEVLGAILLVAFVLLVLLVLLPRANTSGKQRRWFGLLLFALAIGFVLALNMTFGPHPMGVDKRGRDVAARVIYGARISLIVAFVATALIVVIGVVAGMVAGYYRGKIDTALSRTMDLFLAFPVLVLALGLGVACADGCVTVGGKTLIQPGLTVVIFVITLTGWPYMARIIRGQVLSLREREFVEASRSLGASDRRIIFREILPNLVAPIIVYATILIPTNILYEAALSFLGVGVDPDKPSWGAMISDAISIFQDAWWFMLFPGLALLITVLAFNIVGDGLQDALNPRKASK